MQEDVFAASEFGVESGAQFQQGGDAAVNLQAAGGGFADAADELQQGAFAGAVAADDADGFAALDVKANVVQRVEFLAAFGAAGDESVQRVCVGPVGFGEVAGRDDDVVGHWHHFELFWVTSISPSLAGRAPACTPEPLSGRGVCSANSPLRPLPSPVKGEGVSGGCA